MKKLVLCAMIAFLTINLILKFVLRIPMYDLIVFIREQFNNLDMTTYIIVGSVVSIFVIFGFISICEKIRKWFTLNQNMKQADRFMKEMYQTKWGGKRN